MPSVLIVDDEPNIRRMVGALLSAEGYDVRDAADGRAGLALAEALEPDIALVDLMMPGDLDGLALLEKLRERRPDVPVVMMSGRAALTDAVRATRLGAFTFLEPRRSNCGRRAARRRRFAKTWAFRERWSASRRS